MYKCMIYNIISFLYKIWILVSNSWINILYLNNTKNKNLEIYLFRPSGNIKKYIFLNSYETIKYFFIQFISEFNHKTL